jgi:hypothetical protein
VNPHGRETNCRACAVAVDRLLVEGPLLDSRRQRADKMSEAVVRLSLFRNKRFDGYLGVKLPHSLDAEVDAVVMAYVNGSESVNLFHPVLAGEKGWSVGMVTRQGPSSLAW